ncbi:hypothetical protein [Streptomyces sp. NPDC096339]|uniref:hypothetical protein n=1 Tax=Streptomyces sp. NPDC096339 TaxID=3366086 RepID=UPI003821F136
MTETAQQPPVAPEPTALDRLGHCPWPDGVVELRKRREVGTGTWAPDTPEAREAPEPREAREAIRKATTPDEPSERDEPLDDRP